MGTPTLTIDTLERGWKANPDGGGYAFIDGNNSLEQRHFMDKDDFILNYMQDHSDHGATSPFLLHVRWATHGSVTIANCHPFDVPMQGDSEMCMIHNGIIDKMNDVVKGTDLTDTEGLINEVLPLLSDEWLDNASISAMVEDFIDYSKLAFLTTNPLLKHSMYILNSELGVWKDEVWFSNYSCFAYKSAASSYVYKGRSSSDVDDCGYSGWDTNDQFGYYHNGEYKEGTVADYKATDFETWLVDDDDRRTSAKDLRDSTHEEHIAFFNESLVAGDVCSVCTGITSCLCDDICYECYEGYHECQCAGTFVSLNSSFDMEWGERVVAISRIKAA